MISGKKVWLSILCFIMCFLTMGTANTVYAQTKQAELTTLEQQRDLVVMFTFDKEVVDITFISPSGERFTTSDATVEMAEGDLWSTYRISGAESGTWSVEYDLKRNEGIQYSIVEENYGLWLQYLTLSEVADEKMTVGFEADCETEEIRYTYEIYAVNTENTDSVQKVASGSADSNEEIEKEVSLSALSSGTYQLRMEVSYAQSDAELFDSMLSEEFTFTSSREPEQIENYRIDIDAGNSVFDVSWEDFAQWGNDAYRLVVYGDASNPIYDGTLDKNVTFSGVTFPKDTTKLSVSLYYKEDGIWSAPLNKEIDLVNGEYLKLRTNEVTGDEQFILDYSVAAPRTLDISINGGEKSQYQLKESGYLSVPMEQGNNSVYAEFESDNLVFYVIKSDIYFDAYPAELILYEDLDGKTFHTDKVDILGRVEGGNSLLANGEAITIDEAGEFAFPFDLSEGENVLTLEVSDANGNSAVQKLTLYKMSSIAGVSFNVGNWTKMLPLVTALLASAVISLLAVLFLKKKEKKVNTNSKKHLLGWILTGLVIALGEAFCIYEFIVHYLFSKSLSFLEMAERSTQEASKYLNMKNVFGIAAGVGGIIFIVYVVSIFMACKIAKRKQNKVTDNVVKE